MTPVRGMLWIVAVGVTGVTLWFITIYKGTLAPSMRAVVPIEYEGVRRLVAVGIIAEAIHRRVLDQLSMC